MSKLKVGPHLLLQGNADATRWIFGKPSVVKLVNTDIPSEFIHDTEIIWVGRVYENDFDPNNPIKGGFNINPLIAARGYISRYLDKEIRYKPQINFWELNNEPVIYEAEKMVWFSNFLAECIRILREEYNKTAVVGNWSVGSPDFGLWKYYKQTLDAVVKYKAVLGRHGYGPLDIYYALRHRKDNECFTQMGFPNLPVIITEAGAEGLSDVGWTTWRERFGSEQPYVDYLANFDSLLKQDSYVIGATVFTYGFGWPDHNMNDSSVGRLLQDYSDSQTEFTTKIVYPNPVQPPTPPPPPTFQSLEILPIYRNLRANGEGSAKQQAAAYGGTKWKIEEKRGDWYRVTPIEQLWVHKSGIKIT